MEPVQSEDLVVLSIGNIYEFHEKHNSGLSKTDLVARRRKKATFGVSGDLALFWGGAVHSRIVVTPLQPNPIYLDYLRNRLKVSILTLSPKLETGWVCKDLLADPASLSNLITLIGNRSVRVLAWGASSYYYELLTVLEERGVRIVHADFPVAASQWIVGYSDSKSGARELLRYLGLSYPEVQVPTGFVCHSLSEAKGLASFLYERHITPVVVKADWGDGGKAVRVLGAEPDEQDFGMIWSKFVSDTQDNQLWSHTSLSVEVAIGRGLNLTTPSVDGYIDDNGDIHVLGVQNMLTEQQRCIGFEMGRGVFAPDLDERLRNIVRHIGSQLSVLGYRGWFDVDFLLPDDSSDLFISEINPRRTGGSSPLEFAAKRLGNDWAGTHYLMTAEHLELPSTVNAAALMDTVARINDEYSASFAEIVPLHIRGLASHRPYLGYSIYAQERDQAFELESAFIAHLQKRARRSFREPVASVAHTHS